MTTDNNEITIRNSKLKILLKYGFIFGGLLVAELLWGILEQLRNNYGQSKLLINSLIILFCSLLVFGIIDLLDQRPKLKVSKDGITLDKKKMKWSAISKIEFRTTHTKHNSFDFLIVKTNNKKEIRTEITDLDIEKENLKKSINKQSGIDFI